jgi:uncharacterized protein YcaQ
MNTPTLPAATVNTYLAHKQHLLPNSRASDLLRAVRDIVALHSTDPTTPYLSLWARMAGFRREALEDALYERRALTRVSCMRVTLHVVPSDEMPRFFQAYAGRHLRPESRDLAPFLAQAGVCSAEEAEQRLQELQRRVLDVLIARGPSTLREIGQTVPELRAKIRYAEGKAYEGEFSIGSRLVPDMYALGLLVRARPRGTWRSNLYEYAALSDWLPEVDLDSVHPAEARAWLVRRYLNAFGPATADDVQWWTGLTKGETNSALHAIANQVVQMSVEGWDGEYLALADDLERLRHFTRPERPTAFLLPSLDPYIMGYRERRRFLEPEHRAKLFDRAGNAVPTAWANGRVVGAWGQPKDEGDVIYRLFEPVSDELRALLDAQARRLEGFLGGEVLSPRFRTPFTRALEKARTQ